MVYGVMASVAFQAAADRDAFLAAVTKRIANLAKWGLTTVSATAQSVNPLAAEVEVRFFTEADGRAVYTSLATEADTRAPRSGSYLTLHACTHDGAGGQCQVLDLREW